MNFIIVDRQPGGNSGEISIGLAGKAVEIWTLVGDRLDYTTEDVRASGIFPEVYTTFHPDNYRLRLMPIEIEQDDENPAKFVCKLTWTSDKLDPKQKDEKEDSPLNRKARIRVKTGRMKEVRHRDFYGKPKVNAAGDLFDPPIESTVTFRILRIKKNVTVFPEWIFDFDDCVNSLDFTIKGRVIKKGCAWIADIDLGDENTDGPVPYCEAYIEIHVRKRRKPATGESLSDVPYPWEIEQLNEGFFEKKDGKRQRIKVLDADGVTLVPSPSPVPLAANGQKLDPVTIDNATFIRFRDHEERDFNQISYLWSDA